VTGTPFGRFVIGERIDVAGRGFDALATDPDGREVRLWVGAPGVRGADPDVVREELSRVYHSGLPRVLAAESVEDRVVLVMQAYRGRRLSVRLGGGKMEPVEALELARGVGAALVKAHRAGVTHGALDESEILLADDGRALLLHVGFSPFLEERPPRAPEDLAGRGRDSADVFGLSRVLVRALEGADPVRNDALAAWSGRGPETFDPTLPEGLRRLLARALHPDPALRLRRAEELSGDVGVLLASWDSLSLATPRPLVPFGPRVLAGALAAVAILVALAVLAGLRGC
jgi:serine/threonine protein kinase